MTYKPICKPNQLIIGEGTHIAVVTGWTPREAVAKKLDKKDYAVIGNLYSAQRGIPFLIRNLLANPQIHWIIGINSTKEDRNAGSMTALSDFFSSGCDDFAPKDIPEENINEVSKFVSYYECQNILDAIVKIKEIISGLTMYSQRPKWSLLPWAEPRFFPEPKGKTSRVLPASIYGHKIEAKTVAEAWVKILHRIRKNGKIRPTGYDGQWQELINLETIILKEPQEEYYMPNYLPCDRQSVADYLPQILEDVPYREGVKYTYGQRLRSWFGQDQIQRVIEKLIEEPDSASAVMNLWDSGSGSSELTWAESVSYYELERFGRDAGDSDHDHSGSPCLNHIWVRIVSLDDNLAELTLTAIFRSNDMFSAWPFNAFGLRALQEHIYSKIQDEIPLKLTMGKLIIVSQSAHIYDDCFEDCDRLIAEEYPKIIRRSEYNDPVGNFIITIDIEGIHVEQTSPTGETMKYYPTENNVLKLAKKIISENPNIQADHAIYIGVELQKAKTAIDEGWDYEQDK